MRVSETTPTNHTLPFQRFTEVQQLSIDDNVSHTASEGGEGSAQIVIFESVREVPYNHWCSKVQGTGQAGERVNTAQCERGRHQWLTGSPF